MEPGFSQYRKSERMNYDCTLIFLFRKCNARKNRISTVWSSLYAWFITGWLWISYGVFFCVFHYTKSSFHTQFTVSLESNVWLSLGLPLVIVWHLFVWFITGSLWILCMAVPRSAVGHRLTFICLIYYRVAASLTFGCSLVFHWSSFHMQLSCLSLGWWWSVLEWLK
jgi:hypothetical protein